MLLPEPKFEKYRILFDRVAHFNNIEDWESCESEEAFKAIEDLSLRIVGTTRNIEYEYGRQPNSSKFSSRTLDIDILLYGNLQGNFDGLILPRDEITQNAFVLLPLQEIAPTLELPGANKSIAQLWREYDKNQQVLYPIDFFWRGKNVSAPAQYLEPSSDLTIDE